MKKEGDKIMFKLSLNSIVKPKIFWPSVIILLVGCITFYILKEKEKTLRIDTQKQLAETIKVKERVEKEIEEKEYQIKLVLDKLEKEIISRRIAEIQLILATKEKRTLRAKLRQLTEVPEAIELEKVVVKAAPVLFGKVLMVNKEQAFVVVNLGRADNLNLGDILSVYRNSEFIGRVQVERVEEKVSAAAILPDWQHAEFKENDEAREL